MAIAGEHTHDGALSIKAGVQCYLWYDHNCCPAERSMLPRTKDEKRVTKKFTRSGLCCELVRECVMIFYKDSCFC